MQFAIYCLDEPEHLAKRMETRPAHLAYMDEFLQKVVIAGALLDEDGSTMIGSLLIMDFPSRDEAEAFSANDPYRKNGVFGSVTIKPFRKALPKD